MPIYEYSCPECHQIFEEWQQDFEEREVDCPVCSTPSKRVISNTSFILKGSGWYVTDYAGKKPGRNGNGDTKAASDNGNGKAKGKEAAQASDAAPAEAKPSDAKPSSGKAPAASKSETAG